MVTSEQMRRLEQLEAQARVAEVERARHDPELRAQAAELALEFDMTVDELIEESLEIARHIAEIGEAAWEAECLAEDVAAAERLGISIERYRAIDWDAEHADWVAGGSITGAWRGRDWNTWPAHLVAERE